MVSCVCSAASGLNAMETDFRVPDERIEDAGSIGASADAGHDHVRQSTCGGKALLTAFGAHDRLEIAHDGREWMRAND